ncbi:NAD(P)/FAD-dependent oxidoreductase [Jeotgalibacillus sp. R-1-5s-1]|uniref:NAD(P)/FAD-dependent oxidoreductase n=1 Tax=Jeotgalibacillus sp. R-1-5s-1 TaxID=2555897 RepID=UPI00141BD8B9|nr:FAD-dependent oxidoreductase [Jeotgalibacillus sp. R-1-5s-1]
MNTYQTVIVGAGLTGITAARQLQDKRENILIIDKGRSVGGRMATRRIDGGKADHGAQFFTTRTVAFKQITAEWLEKGWIKHWFGDDHPRYASVDGMNALMKRYAEGLPAVLDKRITRIKKHDSGYELTDEQGQSVAIAEKVILTMPIPQITELLETSGMDVVPDLKNVDMTPVVAGLFSFETTPASEKGRIIGDFHEGIDRIIEHKEKGISDTPVATVYMTGEWSKKHFDHDAEETLSYIEQQAAPFFGETSIRTRQLKKWRYAETVNPLNTSTLKLAVGLWAAGDSFLRPEDEAGTTRCESAYLSGLDVAEAVVREQ